MDRDAIAIENADQIDIKALEQTSLFDNRSANELNNTNFPKMFFLLLWVIVIQI